ncbi:hypothetical protein EFD55_26490 [Rhizobium pisi]|uniref:Uncharacterized protein n=1 Tax=Rhizobium pisi TaxID=574561 RepID=A0A3R9ABF9_9HYPH|nr:hypothetical protein EFD55_26490 [Rhizobium pisi]
MRQSAEEEVITVQAIRAFAARPLDLSAPERRLKRADDAFSQLILQVENVLGRTLESVDPDMGCVPPPRSAVR